jgi:ankyrin repeat protein
MNNKIDSLNSAMIQAFQYGDHVGALAALKAGANPDADMGQSITPLLFVAISTDAPQVLKALIEKGAKINAQDNNGHSGLHLACIAGNTGNVDLLMAYGINPFLRNRDGERAVDVVSSKNAEMLEKIDLYTKSWTPQIDNLLITSPREWKITRRIYPDSVPKPKIYRNI